MRRNNTSFVSVWRKTGTNLIILRRMRRLSDMRHYAEVWPTKEDVPTLAALGNSWGVYPALLNNLSGGEIGIRWCGLSLYEWVELRPTPSSRRKLPCYYELDRM